MKKLQKLPLIISVLLLVAAFFTERVTIYGISLSLVLSAVSAVTVGIMPLKEGIENLIRNHGFDEKLLMTVASVAAFVIGEGKEGAAILIFYAIGEMIEEKANAGSRRSVSDLLELCPEYATVMKDSVPQRIKSEEIKPGDILLIKAGDIFPTDCTVAEGKSLVDCSALTGESLPRDVAPNDGIAAGSVNISGVLLVIATDGVSDSTVSKIIGLVENAASRKTKAESFITTFAKYYTPAVIIIALLVFAVPSVITGDVAVWLQRGIAFLVASCPCAIVISVPLCFYNAVGAASKKGILIKGSKYIDLISRADKIVFDKTGTVTKRKFTVDSGNLPSETAKAVAAVERLSSHPIAKAIADGIETDKKAYGVTETAGKGTEGTVDGVKYRIGSRSFVSEICGETVDVKESGITVYVAADGIYSGYLSLTDEIKDEAYTAVTALHKLGLKVIIMTGDGKDNAEYVGAKIGADVCYHSLLPHEKAKKAKEEKGNGPIISVGDGINDAPLIAVSDVGISMGKGGVAAAVEASDAVIMNDDLYKIPEAIRHSRKTMRAVKENIILSIALKLAVQILSFFGIGGLWTAVVGDVGIMLLAVANSLRLRRFSVERK